MSLLPINAATETEQQSQTALLGNMDPNIASVASALSLLIGALASQPGGDYFQADVTAHNGAKEASGHLESIDAVIGNLYTRLGLLVAALGSVHTDTLRIAGSQNMALTQDASGHLHADAYGDTGSGDVEMHVDAQGDVQVDVLTSALPAGAATSAKQDTMITSLQLIDDLRAALASVNSDSLVVRATDSLGNHLDGYYADISEGGTDTNAAGGANSKNLTTVPAGYAYVYTSLVMWNANNTTTQDARVIGGAATTYAMRVTNAVANQSVTYQGKIIVPAGYNLRFVWGNCTAGDDIIWSASGYSIKLT